MAPSCETASRRSTPLSSLYDNAATNAASSAVTTGPTMAPLLQPQRKTVAIAVNHTPRNTVSARDSLDTIESQSVPSSASCNSSVASQHPSSSSLSLDQDNHATCNASSSTSMATAAVTTRATTSTNTTTGRRGRPRKSTTSTRVKYDMELVPVVEKLPSQFWDSIQTWPPRPLPPANSQQYDEGEAAALLGNNSKTNATSKPATDCQQQQQPTATGSTPATSTTTATLSTSRKRPTFFQNSVLFVPTERKDWEDSVSELVALCTSAAYRRHSSAIGKKPFYPPLSKDYIEDRIDIDDPLRGYQIRHALGGWLQGFLLWTNFTTWNNEFAWDSLHSASGVMDQSPPGALVDSTGELAKELQHLPRHGNVHDHGVIVDHVAEIALLGGLGCGELLLRMVLEDIRRANYKFVVLQATEGSRSFYERFGFVRVGAVCSYDATTTSSNTNTITATDTTDHTPETLSASSSTPSLQGYRHWTHPNESQKSLDLHGGPSYMMCLKLPDPQDNVPIGNLTETMKQYQVDEKPIVKSLGSVSYSSSSPSSQRKKVKPNNSSNNPSLPGLPSLTHNNTLDDVASNTVPRRRRGRPRKRVYSESNANEDTSNAILPSTRLPNISSKRRKVSEEVVQDPTSMSTSSNRMLSSSSGLSTRQASKPAATMASTTTSNHSGHSLATPPTATRSTRTAVPSTTPKSTTATKKRTSANSLSSASNSAAASSQTKNRSAAAIHKTESVPSGTSSQRQAREYLAMHPTLASTSSNTSSRKKKAFAINKTILCKQKVKSYPRDRAHFYNKVVQHKNSISLGGSHKKNSNKKKNHQNEDGEQDQYYFVLDYNESEQQLTLIPMQCTGVLSGKRAGRPRFQCIVLDDSSNWKVAVPTSDYMAVSAFMVMKTPYVSQEAWDILGGPEGK
mmetsp:Transcript_1550/g.2686  ORF Transcript_1550/g.2686 Transcript_1550/m.2686 type:complete len:907 (+) Transcript_1550:151-2871(+)